MFKNIHGLVVPIQKEIKASPKWKKIGWAPILNRDKSNKSRKRSKSKVRHGDESISDSEEELVAPTQKLGTEGNPLLTFSGYRKMRQKKKQEAK